MPMPEERLAGVSSAAEFGALLTELRERARLTVREVARKSGLAPATAGGYFAGTHLPALRLLGSEFTQLLIALGVRDEAQLEAWREAARRLRRSGRRRTGDRRPPYRGLAPFEAEDAEWYFGRAELVATVRRRAAERRREGLPLLVVGPSGSGKSSLLRAGLIPSLRAEGTAALLTPGRDALAALAAAAPLEQPADWIVVDQFEQVFTHELPTSERASFIEELLHRCSRSGVVIGLRADFYAAALVEPGLAPAMQDGQVIVGPMNTGQIREAIVRPARLAGAEVADGLVELLIEQCFRLGRDHVGTLPLLSHALLATWSRHEGDILTSQDYLATGGIADAIAHSAEEAYGGLGPPDRELVRIIFVHLVHVGEGVADTARKVAFDSLPGGTHAGSELPEPMEEFIDRRLLTVDAGTVQIAHEALISSWPRLRAWLDTDRAVLIAQRRLAFAAENWVEAGRDPAALLRGGPLTVMDLRVQEAGERWRPTALEREFLEASRVQRSVEERARILAARRLRILAGALASLLFVATGMAFYAFVQRGDAQSATRTADARAVAEAAGAVRGLDPTAAAQLSLASYRMNPTIQSRSALLESTGTAQASRVVDAASVVEALAGTADRNLAAAADADGTLRLWNISRPGVPTAIGQPLLHLQDRQLFAVAISPDGRLLAASGSEETISVWNIANPAVVHALPALTGPTNTVYTLAFNPAGTLLAAGSADGTIRLWHVSSTALTPTQTVTVSPTAYVQSLAFNPNGTMLAATTSDGQLLTWPVAPDATLAPAPTADHSGLGGPVLGLAFNPAGNTLATGTKTSALQLWTVTTSGGTRPDGPALTIGNSWINALAFSPDGSQLAVATSAKSVELWDPATHALITTLPHPEPVASIAWDRDSTLISGCADGVLRFWSLPVPQLPGKGVINEVSFSSDDHLIAVASNTLQLWYAADRTPASPPIGTGGLPAEAVAFSPTAPLLATALSNGSVRLWNVSDPAAPVPVGPPQPATTAGIVENIAFSPDGTLLATGSDDTLVRLWNVTSARGLTLRQVLPGFTAGVYSLAFNSRGTLLGAGSIDRSVRLWSLNANGIARPLAALTRLPAYVYSVAFQPNGIALAVGLANGTVQLWNLGDPPRPEPLGQPLTGPLGYTYAIDFSPDGSTLAAADTDDDVWLWNVKNLRHPSVSATLTGATDALYTVAFSPDGNLLAAGGAEGVVRLWVPKPTAAQSDLCADLGQALDKQAWSRDAPGLPVTAPCG